MVDYSGTVCYTSEDYDVLQASMKREHVTADSILIFSENGYEKTLTERNGTDTVRIPWMRTRKTGKMVLRG